MINSSDSLTDITNNVHQQPAPNKTNTMQRDQFKFSLRRRRLSQIMSVTPSSASGFFDFANDESSQVAGICFQASLLPYIVFLYFLSVTDIPPIANFGFQYLLVFVVASIVAGVLAQSQYDVSLADSDWLHGTAESMLTVSNLLLVYGLHHESIRMRLHNPTTASNPSPILVKMLAMGWAVLCFLGMVVGFTWYPLSTHSQLLGGFGNIPSISWMPWAKHPEPSNALSIPTWIVHWSSVYEYLVAMKLIWRLPYTTGNSTWKGLTWGMLPLHASSICAVTHHFFYNSPALQFLVSLQGFLTLVGNWTTMIATNRIAQSLGWRWSNPCMTNPGGRPNTDINTTLPLRAPSQLPIEDHTDTADNLFVKLVLLVVGTSYLVKYGELGLQLPVEPNPHVAVAMIVCIPSLTALHFAYLSLLSEVPRSEESANVTLQEERLPLKTQNSSNGYGSQANPENGQISIS